MFYTCTMSIIRSKSFKCLNWHNFFQIYVVAAFFLLIPFSTSFILEKVYAEDAGGVNYLFDDQPVCVNGAHTETYSQVENGVVLEQTTITWNGNGDIVSQNHVSF